MGEAINTNILTPISLIDLVAGKIRIRRFGSMVNINSCNVKAPLSVFCLSDGARRILTGCISGLAKKQI